ncbi:MAG: hypothetical protein FWF50_00190 [Defluviitaleaceae bacterium]|nr:hypothetical protein [Defluviitaleaceae bacterium]
MNSPLVKKYLEKGKVGTQIAIEWEENERLSNLYLDENSGEIANEAATKKAIAMAEQKAVGIAEMRSIEKARKRALEVAENLTVKLANDKASDFANSRAVNFAEARAIEVARIRATALAANKFIETRIIYREEFKEDIKEEIMKDVIRKSPSELGARPTSIALGFSDEDYKRLVKETVGNKEAVI